MPLIREASDEARKKNIAKLIAEGKTPAEAVAIAYSIQEEARKGGGKK